MCTCQEEQEENKLQTQVHLCDCCGLPEQHCQGEKMEARESLWDIILVLMVIAYVLMIVRLITLVFGSKKTA